MSTPNVNLTLPTGIVGAGTAIKVTDHGPFYFFSPAFPIHRVSQNDSVPHIYPCAATICTDWAEHLPEEQCPPGQVVRWNEERDQVGNRIRVGTCLIPAEAIMQSVLEVYGGWGIRQLHAFTHKSAEEIQLPFFNKILQPERIEPEEFLSEELMAEIAKLGGLAVRKRFVETGAKFIASKMFAEDFGKELQSLYIEASQEALASFVDAIRIVSSELNNSDNEIRLRLAGAGGKATYDPRDGYMQWLLARKPVMEQQDTKQQVVVQLPEGFNQGGGLSKDDLLAVIQAANENAVKIAMAQQEPKKAKTKKDE